MRGLLGRLRAIRRGRRAADADTRDEFAFHIESRVQALMREGLSLDAARRRARLEFGSVAAYEEEGRQARGLGLLDDFVADLRFGVRMLGRQPVTALVIVLTLALGIGANTAIFSVVNAIFLRPLPVVDPGRLVLFSGDASSGTISSTTPPEGTWTLFSSDASDYIRAAPLPFTSVAAFESDVDDVAVRRLDQSGAAASGSGTTASAHLVSGNYFDVMGVKAALGRTFVHDDDRPAAAPVAAISDGYWRREFHADPHVVGSVVTINQVAFTVVGVLPAPFFGERVRSAPDIWAPLARQPEIQRRESFLLRPDYYWLNLIGRLAPGQSRQAAEGAVTGALRQFLTAHAGASADAATQDRIRGVRVAMVSGAGGISVNRQQDTAALTLLLVSVGLVLLIACANVATLLLCRATARETEVAVRRALGAGRARLARQWLTESTLLAALGATGGVLLAHWAVPTLRSYFPSGPVKVEINAAVLFFTIGITCLASLLFGLVPALQAARPDALASLRSSGHGSRRRRRAFGATEPFVVAQIAISLVLALGATLFARSLFNLERAPFGFDQDRVLLIRIDPGIAGYTPATVGALYRRLYVQVAALPGVESATFARYSPFGGYSSSFKGSVEGYAPPPGETVRLDAVNIGPNYPQTIGMPLVAGRAITLEDGPGAKLVALVNEAFARRFFPHSSPVGRTAQLDESYEIVGVVKDALFHSAREKMIPFVFTSMLQDTSQRVLGCEIELRARAGVDANTLAPLVRQIVTGTDRSIVIGRTRTLRAQVLSTFGPERAAAGFVSAFAVLALLVAAVGLYGVVSHGVARRTKEIGVRVALGAAPGSVVWLILRETFVWLAVGLALGGAASLAVGHLIAHQLFGLSAADPVAFLTASAVLAGVALLTTLVPAVRALHVYPFSALRAE